MQVLAPTASLSPSSAREEPSLRLPRSYWKDFARKYWDREPVILRNPFSADFPSTEEFFDLYVSASERWLKGEVSLATIRLFIEHTDSPDVLPYYTLFYPSRKHLPQREDGSLEGYFARADEWLRGKRFGLIINGGQDQTWRHWQQMASFLSPVVDVLGVPMSGADSTVFLGNYRYTPFGIHKDHLHVFSFVIGGRKSMSFWPFEKLSHREELPKNPQLIDTVATISTRDEADMEQMLSQATLLDADPGDIIYWPASYWHRAEPSTTPYTLTASLGVRYDAPECFKPQRVQGPGRLRASEMPTRSGWKLPTQVRTALKAPFQRENARTTERERTAEWAGLLSGAALAGAPPDAQEPPLVAGDWIRVHPDRPLVQVSQPGGYLILAGVGRSTTLQVSPAVRRRLVGLVKKLNSAEPQQVEALEQAFFSRLPARAFTRKAFHTLLNDLVRWHALLRCPAPALRSVSAPRRPPSRRK